MKRIYLLAAFLLSTSVLAHTTTTNMSLLTPEAGDTDYPTSISTSFTLLDAHDHSSGKGVQISASGLATSSVTSAKILDGTIAAIDIASDAITTAKILDSNVTGAKLSSNVVDNSTLQYSSSQVSIKDSGVTTAKINDSAVTTAKINDGAITQAKRAALSMSVSTGMSGAVSTTSATYVNMTSDLSLTIITTGRPVLLMLGPNGASGGTNGGYILNSTDTGAIAITRGGVVIAEFGVGLATVPSSSVTFVDTPAAGNYTYNIQAKSTGGSTTTIHGAQLVAIEL